MGFLTDKERRRVAEVNKMISEGINPFADLTARLGNFDQGGLDKDRKVRATTEVKIKPQPCKELHKKNIPHPMYPVPPGLIMCSFCGHRVKDDHKVTRGTMSRQSLQQNIMWDENHRIAEVEPRQLRFSSVKVAACADCAIQLVATKDQTVPTYNVQWPETE